MPVTKVIFYREKNRDVPFLRWLDSLPRKVLIKCLVKLKRLEECGHELRRPEADLLRDGIHELRIRLQSMNYRILYFFHGSNVAIVSHGCTKEKNIPSKEIDFAVARKKKLERDPSLYSFENIIGEN